MTIYDGSFGYMIQGVSQQPARVQPEGHVKQQINMLSDPERGLISRPGSVVGSTGIMPTCAFGSQYNHVIVGSTPYLIAVEPAGRVRAFTYPTMSEVVVAGHSGFTGYTAGGTYSAFAIGNTVYLLNQDKTVLGSTVVNSTDLYSTWGYVFCLGGMLSRTYKLNIRYSDGTVATGTYTTPDDPSGGDQNKTSGGWIIEQLHDSIIAHANYKAGVTTIQRARDHLSIIITDGVYDLTTEDGEGNTTLRCGRASAEVMENVPQFAPVGAIVRVYGDKGTKADDVWLRFESTVGVTTVGNGMGRPGRWVETVDPNNGYAIDASTMPHILTFSAGSFTLTEGNWLGRRVGAPISNPIPGFINRKITDIGEVANRVYMIAGKTFNASQTRTANNNGHNDFFRKTASEWLATDPISVQESGGGSGDLLYGILYDKNLVIAAEKGQFFISGTEALTPQTVAMPKTSTYNTEKSVKPIVVENYLLYPFSRADFAGVNEVRPTTSVLDTYIDETTKVVTKYIPGKIKQITASSAGRIVVCRNTQNPSRLYVYQYLWSGNEKKQNAWHTWQFGFNIDFIQFVDNRLYFLYRNPNNDGRPMMAYIDVDRPTFGIHPSPYLLDLQQEIGTLGNSALVKRGDYIFVASTDTENNYAGGQISPVSYEFSGTSGTFEAGYDLFGSVYGVPYVSSVTVNDPKVVDWRGRAKTNVDVLIEKYVADYYESGPMAAYVKSSYVSPVEQLVWSNDSLPLVDDPENVDLLSDGKFDVPWGYDPKFADMVLKSATHIPISITEVRWYGEYFENRV